MTKYFVNCKTLDELKKAYKAAAMKYHPDMGGDTATMQAINAEYEARFEVLKRSQNEQAAEDTTGKTHATTESDAKRLYRACKARAHHFLTMQAEDDEMYKLNRAVACDFRALAQSIIDQTNIKI